MSMVTAPAPGLPLDRPKKAPLDPPPEFARLRDEQPITRVSIWDGRLTPWLVTRWADARAVLGNRAFSSEDSLPGFPNLRPGMPPSPPGALQAHDAPVHTTMRRALTREFIVKRIDELRPSIRETADRLIDDMTALDGPVDLVEHLALPLPTLVACDLLGVPYEDHPFFQDKANTLVDNSSTAEQVETAERSIAEYLLNLLLLRRSRPCGDLMSRLARKVDGASITDDDAAELAAFLLLAGHETTANMIALSTITLLQHPDQIPRLFIGPEETALAVEELLRFVTVIQAGLRRRALEDVTVGGVTIRAGEGVIIPLNVANRDPDAFPEPDRLDLGRPNARRHVNFGYGVHQCLGQSLARAELQIMLPAIFRRLPGLRVTAPIEDLPYKEASIYGVHRLPVTW
ncbi:cytochrome P450 [Nocardiopsis mangrovi]|uniref:Cytochrome P450 n=1 Tax=Nocardiopsis mangrovi TaxID=1179818 RepID=A0ABV9DX00_9ACTN